jgi:tellurite resistance protein TerC
VVFVGAKIFVADLVLGGARFPPAISLGVTVAPVASGILFALWKTGSQARKRSAVSP